TSSFSRSTQKTGIKEKGCIVRTVMGQQWDRPRFSNAMRWADLPAVNYEKRGLSPVKKGRIMRPFFYPASAPGFRTGN
ncbi:MAG: hypothetical protein WBO37_13665, partial [Gammaproteobacteria bacterium]